MLPNSTGYWVLAFTVTACICTVLLLYSTNLDLDGNWYIYSKSNSPSRCPNEIVLSVELGGNTANQIFEYLSVYSISQLGAGKFIGYVPRQIKQNLAVIFENVSLPDLEDLPPRCLGRKIVIKKQDPPQKIFDIGWYNYVLLEMYSARYEEIIDFTLDNTRRELKFRKEDIEYAQKTLKVAETRVKGRGPATFIGMHYRGDDYVPFLESFHVPGGPSTYEYYNNAIKYFMGKFKNPIFILISSDGQWVDENRSKLMGNLVVNPNFMKQSSKVKDFVLLSMCNHSIINYGTFGTAAALFSGGDTVAYDLEIPLDHRGPTIAMGISKLLKNWVLLSNN